MNKVRSELSGRNPSAISGHRYYELRHWCLQYPDWKKELWQIERTQSSSLIRPEKRVEDAKRPVEELSERIEELKKKIQTVDRIAEKAGGEISKWLKIGVTEDRSFNELKTLRGLPCERDMYYRCYRLFFKILSDEKP